MSNLISKTKKKNELKLKLRFSDEPWTKEESIKAMAELYHMMIERG